MVEKLAIKRLTASDLTFFEYHYQTLRAGNQKSINLNKNVFIDRLYPDLPARVGARDDNRIHVRLRLYGPGLAPEMAMNKQIIKGGAYKNWRLNGAFIRQVDTKSRFDILQPGDMVVFSFDGDVVPDEVRAVFLATANPDDVWLHEECTRVLEESGYAKGMCPVQLPMLETIASSPSCPEGHPIRVVAFSEALEGLALGDPARRASSRRPKLTKGQASLLRDRTSEVGDAGETLVNDWLAERLANGEIMSYEWTAATDAYAPYDFEVRPAATQGHASSIRLDVKTTTGSFDRCLHLSLAEAEESAEPGRYDLYRVYELGEGCAKMRILQDLRRHADALLAASRSLPGWARAEGFVIDPAGLPFGPEQSIVLGDPTQATLADDET